MKNEVGYRQTSNLFEQVIMIAIINYSGVEEMANFRVCNGLPMTDTWLNQGGDASMATVASREIRSRGKEQGNESSKG